MIYIVWEYGALATLMAVTGLYLSSPARGLLDWEVESMVKRLHKGEDPLPQEVVTLTRKVIISTTIIGASAMWFAYWPAMYLHMRGRD